MAHAAEFSDYLIRTENGKLRIGEDGHPIDLRGQTTEDKLKFIKKPSLTLKQPSGGKSSKSKVVTGSSKDEMRNPSWPTFLFRLVLESFFLGKLATKRQLNIFEWKRCLEPLKNISVVGLLVLGCLVFSLLFKAYSTGQEYFEEQLSKPELRHFLIKQNEARLDLNSTASLKEILRALLPMLRAKLHLQDDRIFFKQ